ncbi:MAG: 4Fe-4S binding protein [Dethiobacteria bacterium]|nr:4Fe-4S binding protein [Bacillota bacterium]
MLEVNFAGLKLRNPVIAASATPTTNGKFMIKAAEGGAGAVVTKSVVFPSNGKPVGLYPRPRFMLMNNSTGYDPRIANRDGYFTLFRAGETYPTPEEMLRYIDEYKNAFVDAPIIVSICGAVDDLDEWAKLAKQMEAAGADALELNLHCIPSVKYTNPDIVKVVKDAVEIPVIGKLMFVWEDPAEIGPKIEEAGVDAITAIGSFRFPVLEIDTKTKKPMLQPTFLGSGGTWLRPLSLAYVAKLAQTVKVPLSGVTGVATWEDAAKYLLAGATTVQVCGAIYAKGFGVLGEIASGLEQYFKQEGFAGVEQVSGKALDSIKSKESLEYMPPVKAYVDQSLCTGCGNCVKSCFWDAYDLSSGKAEAITDNCDGCGVCVSICPQNAVSMKRYD